MPLTLVTGPANAAKAGAVLERLSELRDRDPLLVVPTGADAEHYRRELAATGSVFGAEVVTFRGLFDALARAAGRARRPLGPLARERVIAAVIAEAELTHLAASAGTRGFAVAAGRLFAELQRALVRPERLTAAVRSWAKADGERRTQVAQEVAGLYAAYRDRLAALGRTDVDGFAWQALDGVRERPSAWSRPVLFYGFDDFSGVELDAVETLVRFAGADVLVALPFERGRRALQGRAASVELLRPLADAVRELPDRAEHYSADARPALHHLERHLFEPDAPRRAPNGAVRLLEAGGERAEAELVAASVLELIRDGLAPEDVAVVVRGGAPAAALHVRTLERCGVPVAADARVALASTRLGAGLLALARLATGAGDDPTGDLLAWLRTPGRLPRADAADRVERALGRAEVEDRARVLALARDYLPDRVLDSVERVREAAASGAVALVEALLAEGDAIWTAPHRRRADVLEGPEREDARAMAGLRAALGELRGAAALDPALDGGAAESLEAIGELRVRDVRAGGVLVADPLGIRARRFRAVVLCGCQDGEWPQRPSPEPFLDDEDRRAIARASGLVLRSSEATLERERSLFYACVSRPEDALLLAWRSSDEEGDPKQASPFLDDVRALYTEELWLQRGRRLLADLTWPPTQAPTPRELQRAQAARRALPDPPPLAPPARPEVLERLAARGTEPARGLETFAACGVRWLIESLLAPRRAGADPEPLKRGALAHRVLESTLARLLDATGSARLASGREAEALAALQAAVEAEAPRVRGGVRGRALLHAVRVELERFLTFECARGAGLEPARLEWAFGSEGAAAGSLALAADVAVSGRVDRIDVDPAGRSLVRDYKTGAVRPGRDWASEGALQAPLYALAARELLGLRPAGAVYQPVRGRDLTPRGYVEDGVPGTYKPGDVVAPAELEAALERARAVAVDAARRLKAGDIRPCQERCSPRGCAYPAICRAGEPVPEEEVELGQLLA
jgi:ATP-dependent helicase/DNAse subunit B